MSKMLIVGRGRIGGAVGSTLADDGWAVKFAQLDPQQGLLIDGETVSGIVDKLLICISPPRAENRTRKPWAWADLTAALTRQILTNTSDKTLTINQLYFVSSSRVYDGYPSGLVWADSPARAESDKARALLAAEQAFMTCAASTTIVRPTGLYGLGYQRYHDIIRQPSAKYRHGVAAEQVTLTILKLCQLPVASQPRAMLLTDGKVYKNGVAIKLNQAGNGVAQLARKQRILINSVD